MPLKIKPPVCFQAGGFMSSNPGYWCPAAFWLGSGEDPVKFRLVQRFHFDQSGGDAVQVLAVFGQ
jgi:hypothetical protein